MVLKKLNKTQFRGVKCLLFKNFKMIFEDQGGKTMKNWTSNANSHLFLLFTPFFFCFPIKLLLFLPIQRKKRTSKNSYFYKEFFKNTPLWKRYYPPPLAGSLNTCAQSRRAAVICAVWLLSSSIACLPRRTRSADSFLTRAARILLT